MAEGILNPIPQLEADFDFDVYTKQEVDALLDTKADKVDTYTKTETDTLLSAKADADNVYTKTETDNLLSAKADKSTTLAGYGITDAYTKTETDNLLNGKADADSVYTKQEIDTKIPSSVGSATKPTYVNGGVITECTYELNKTVPANAVFTDTTYSAGNGLNLSGTSFSAKAGTNVTVDASGINVNGSGTVASADSGLINGGTAYTELRPTLDGTWVKNTQTTATNLQRLEGGIEYLYGLLSHQYDQLKKYINGNYYDYDTDNDSKYTKTVLNGAMPYASLDSVGGKTLVWNQLVQNGDFVDSTGWAGQQGTLSVADNVATVTCSANYGRLQCTSLPTIIVGHKYLLMATIKKNIAFNGRAFNFKLGATTSSTLWSASVNTWETFGTLFTATANGGAGDYLYIADINTGYEVGTVVDVKNVICIDLTLMFGSGNEPTTVDEFTAQFPADYYPYSQGQLLSAGVTSVISKKADTTEIATYSIPAEVQALEGYGWSAGTAYNYIDYERKVFVQNVDRVDLGSLWWIASGSHYYSSDLNGLIKPTASKDTIANIVCVPYIAQSYNTLTSYTVDKCISVGRGSGVQDNIQIYDTSMANASALKTSLDGIYLYYPLNTPIETDISAYLTDDNLIEVEAGGSLTFPNQHGDDYRIDVPSAETYMVDLQSAL